MIQIKYNDYTLEYNRDAIKQIEARGFSFQNMGEKLVTNLELLFWGAFQKNHKGLHINKTNEILDEMIADGYDIEELAGASGILYEMINEALPLAQEGKDKKKFEVIRSK